MFNDDKGRHVVLYLALDHEGVKIDLVDKEPGKDNLEPTVLIPQELFKTDPIDRIMKVEAELISRSPNQNFMNVFGVMISDRLEIMRNKKKMKQKQNAESMKGKVEGNNAVNFKEMTCLDGCLSAVKGSVEYIRRERSDILVRQCQNGVKNIKIDWCVFSGYSHHLEDNYLAACLLRPHHTVNFMEKSSNDQFPNKEYLVCCDSDFCDPFVCLNEHLSPASKLASSGYDLDPIIITNCIVEKVKCFVNKIVKPIAKEFALFLNFERPTSDSGTSGFNLSGHVWLDELEDFNTSGKPLPPDMDFVPEVLSPASMQKIFGGNGVTELVENVVIWPNNLYSDTGEVSKKVKENVNFEDIDSCREVGVFEAVCMCDRNIALSYTNQSVVFINTDDPRKVFNIINSNIYNALTVNCRCGEHSEHMGKMMKMNMHGSTPVTRHFGLKKKVLSKNTLLDLKKQNPSVYSRTGYITGIVSSLCGEIRPSLYLLDSLLQESEHS